MYCIKSYFFLLRERQEGVRTSWAGPAGTLFSPYSPPTDRKRFLLTLRREKARKRPFNALSPASPYGGMGRLRRFAWERRRAALSSNRSRALIPILCPG